jgi:hypothetical protein
VSRIRVLVALILTGAVIGVAALASGESASEVEHNVATNEPELRAALRGVDSGNIIAMGESKGSLTTTDYGAQTELDPDHELFAVIRVDDLPAELREGATVQGFTSEQQPGVVPPFEGVMLWAFNVTAFIPSDVSDGEGAYEGPGFFDLRAGRPPVVRSATTNVWIMVSRFPSAATADDFVVPSSGEGESDSESAQIILRDFGSSREFDLEEALRDNERTYNELRVEALDVAGLGDRASGERRVVAVLDYDPVANVYRSDAVLHWEYSEFISFTSARYTVMLTRAASSLTDDLPADVDLSSLARLAYERIEGLQ